MIQGDPSNFYLNGDYEKLNPSWDTGDSAWKATLVAGLLTRHSLRPSTMAEVGCGAGAVLAALQRHFPLIRLQGWDIAPGAEQFWARHEGIFFARGDFASKSSETFDVVLLLDVIEHVSNPHDFLSRLRARCKYLVLHVPLDLSAASVLRETPLLNQRRTVGHIHYFTRALAVELLVECGYEVLEASFSGAHLRRQTSVRGKCFQLFRRVVFALNREVGVRLLGGDTLVILARPL